MKRKTRSLGDERGAMLAQAVIAIVGLIALTTFVVDFGVLWVGRGAAQNSADAGALAGATALAFDSYTDRSLTGPAVQSAQRLAKGNWVVDQSPDVQPTTDITFPTCPDGSDGCIRVDVYRGARDASNTVRGIPLPVIFGGIVGLTGQGVKATAIGEVLAGNASNCIKPWVVVDRWQENLAPAGEFDKYYKCGNSVCTYPGPVDNYVWPSTTTLGTGYNPKNDMGLQLTLKAGGPSTALQPGFYYPVDLPLPPSGAYITGGSQYRTNIASCTGWPVTIGTPSNPTLLPPENGNMVGPTAQGLDALYNLDPGAYWNSGSNSVQNSCAPGACGTVSPRIVAIALVDPDALASSIVSTGGKNLVLSVTNIMGFFIDKPNGSGSVTGHLTSYPGLTIGSPTIGPGSAFLVNPVLVR